MCQHNWSLYFHRGDNRFSLFQLAELISDSLIDSSPFAIEIRHVLVCASSFQPASMQVE